MVIVLVFYICVCPEVLSCIKGLDISDKNLVLMELMVEHVSRKIQFGFIIFVVGDSFVVWVVVSRICSDCDPVQMLGVDDG